LVFYEQGEGEEILSLRFDQKRKLKIFEIRKGKDMENKEKNMQPPYQKEREGLSSEEAAGSREGWNVQDLADQASQKNVDEIQRETLRGDETEGDADNRDMAGNVERHETAQGREEAKNDVKGKANANG
jgi:hypothetical protein